MNTTPTKSGERCQIIHGDCVEEMAKMPADSIDLIVTSPPYDAIRDYGGFKFDFEATAKAMLRVIVPGGVIAWVVSNQVKGWGESLTAERQRIRFQEIGFKVRKMIYQKPNFSSPCADFYHRIHEDITLCCKGTPRIFNPLMDRKNITAGSVGNLGVNTFTERDGSKSVREKKVCAEFGKRHDVWFGPTRGQEDMCIKLEHPAMMPKWLARDLILSWSNVGDTVMDPMAGSGTVNKMAISTARKTIAIDCNVEYCRLIEQETNITPGLAI